MIAALIHTTTLDEQERAAYQRGDYVSAALLGECIDTAAELAAIGTADIDALKIQIHTYKSALEIIGCDEVAPENLEAEVTAKISALARRAPATPATENAALLPVLQSIIATLSCALREPGKVGKRHLTSLADFLDQFGFRDDPGITPEAARLAVYAAFGGFLPPEPIDEAEAVAV